MRPMSLNTIPLALDKPTMRVGSACCPVAFAASVEALNARVRSYRILMPPLAAWHTSQRASRQPGDAVLVLAARWQRSAQTLGHPAGKSGGVPGLWHLPDNDEIE